MKRKTVFHQRVLSTESAIGIDQHRLNTSSSKRQKKKAAAKSAQKSSRQTALTHDGTVDRSADVKIDPKKKSGSAPKPPHPIQLEYEDDNPERHRALTELHDSISRKFPNETLVFGRGKCSAPIMIIGEAPGMEEILQGKPFVGPSGQLLKTELVRAGINENSECYITNLVKYHMAGNNDPNFPIVRVFAPYLKEEITIVRPRVIVTLGAIATTIVRCNFSPEVRDDGVSLKTLSIAGLLACGIETKTKIRVSDDYHPRTIALYHPAFFLHSKDFKSPKFNQWVGSFSQIAKMRDKPAQLPCRSVLLPEEELLGACISNPERRSYVSRTPHIPIAHGSDLDLFVTNVRYDYRSNTFSINARTKAGNSVHLKVDDIQFKIYAEHEYLNLHLSDGLLKSINEDIEAALYATGSGAAEVSIECKRPFIGYHPATKPFFAFDFTHWYDAEIIRKCFTAIAQQKCVGSPVPVFYEGGMTPDQVFMLKNNIYSYGWITIQDWEHDYENAEDYTTDHALLVKEDQIKGHCPNPGLSLKDPSHTEFAPMTVISWDIEMLNEDNHFPCEDFDPVISIAAYAVKINDPLNPTVYEEARDFSDPSGQKYWQTGRVNYSHGYTFIIGDTPRLTPAPFRAAAIPNAPNPPTATPSQFKDREPFVECLRTWNAFVKKVFPKWVQMAGTARRDVLLAKSDRLREAVLNIGLFTEDNPSWEGREQWDAHARSIVECWAERDARDVSEFKIDDDRDEKHVGTVQARWHAFYLQTEVFCFSSERDMILGFLTYVRQLDPDVMIGYNVSFDFNVVLKRVRHLNIRDSNGTFFAFGRFRRLNDGAVIKRKTSKQTGDREIIDTKVLGRSIFDLLQYYQKEWKEKNYTLGAVSEHHLRTTKADLMYSAIPRTFFKKRARLVKYGEIDAELPMMHCFKQGCLAFSMIVDRLCSTIFIGDNYTKGLMIRVFSALMREMKSRDLDMVMHDINPLSLELTEEQLADPKRKKYQGALVMEPKTGYITVPLICIDFSSLYPSEMIWNNTGVNVWITIAKAKELGMDVERDLIKSPIPLPFKSPDDAPQHFYMVRPRVFTERQADDFAAKTGLRCEKNAVQDVIDGLKQDTYSPMIDVSVVSAYLKNGLAARKIVKDEMEKHPPDSDKYKVLNYQQLALKLMNNSCYGVCGKESGLLAALFIAAWVTAAGREENVACLQRVVDDWLAAIYGGDTDSTFDQIPGMDSLDDVFKPITKNEVTKPFIKHVMDSANRGLKWPMKVEFEKVIGGGPDDATLIFKKKQMCATYYMVAWNSIMRREEISKYGKREDKGLAAKRRDSDGFCQMVLRKMGDVLCKGKRDPKGAYLKVFDLIQSSVNDLVHDRIDLHLLVQTRQYAKVNPKTSLPQNNVVRKQNKRGAQNANQLGDRISFLIAESTDVLENGSKRKQKTFEKAEDSLHFLRTDQKPDFAFTIARLQKSARKYLELAFTGEQPIMKGGEAALERLEKELYHSHRVCFTKKISDDNTFLKWAKKSHSCPMCNRHTLNEKLCDACEIPPVFTEQQADDFTAKTGLRCEKNPAQDVIDGVKQDTYSPSVKETLDHRQKTLATNLERVAVVCRKCMLLDDDETEIPCVNAECKYQFSRIRADNSLKNFLQYT